MRGVRVLAICSLFAELFAFTTFWRRPRHTLFQSENDEDFDGRDFDNMLKSAGPVWSTDDSSETIRRLREEQIAREEDIYRKYPFTDVKLPVLPDCNNYFSGKFGNYFWHQNSDQVYVYIPVEEALTKRDVDVDFQALQVTVNIKGKKEVYFKCLERIIPDGSFWTFEKDGEGKTYIQLDLEKRYRMINWRSLFGNPKPNEQYDALKKSEMMEKLLAANQGLSKLTGKPAETMDEMMSNEQLVKMLGQKYFPDPEVLEVEGDESTGDDTEDIPDLKDIEVVLDKNDEKNDENESPN